MKLTIKDETFAGDILNEIMIEIQSESTSAREIITARVTQEVADYNSKAGDKFNGLVQPTDAERSLNGYRLKTDRFIDSEKQVYVALDAFQKNGFFMLIDNTQIESLDQEVLVRPDTHISFIKLTPLVGGWYEPDQ